MPVKQNAAQTELDALSAAPLEAQRAAGYAHTLAEILQQPSTWRETARALAGSGVLDETLQGGVRSIVLTGSGSSVYAGEAIAPALQRSTGVPTLAIPAGTLLTHWREVLPADKGVLVSIARSGDSPESCGAVSRLLTHRPDVRHVVLTCNAQGQLVTRYRDDERVEAVVLAERTNDRSLVMTSSFSNLMLAGALLADATIGADAVESVANAAETVFGEHADDIARLARGDVRRVLYLGSGGGVGAARECALKMLEMTGGRVTTMAESFLGLRHGPMANVDAHTLIVAFLSTDPVVRAYETDLLAELAAKGLGMARIVVGADVPAMAGDSDDVAIELPMLRDVGDTLALLPAVVVGQLLAFFRCLALGFAPDTPSQGVLTRVVGEFVMHSEDAP
ncbi:galactosamine 6-phosphate isomerase AgaS [Luteibacter rhizovicinus]|uniref:Galactosamine 6-phosphate isomerase AgaS n=1 Tax=Luteibacter rhizovicinus TaxID=242606 RepID=A0A4R3YWC4_9GAMM|nr:SIS domain-containing protein [Luteibacter rhizovicinus]TCV97465.1 galactosamine 6-phosphate isomerase AgaS [Luteibacter rhizovicinus]